MRARRRSRATLTIVACLGDSISAGSPLWDPDPIVRDGIDTPDERSQWEWWAARRHPGFEFRNHGVYGERTDEIAARLDGAVQGASSLVVQGGINDVARLNMLIRAVADGLGVPLLPFHDTLVDPARPHRMRDEWTVDGDHPSVEGHRLLGERAFRQP